MHLNNSNEISGTLHIDKVTEMLECFLGWSHTLDVELWSVWSSYSSCS